MNRTERAVPVDSWPAINRSVAMLSRETPREAVLGDIVHYVPPVYNEAGEEVADYLIAPDPSHRCNHCYAALVSAVLLDGEVNLHIFEEYGTLVMHHAVYSEVPKPNTWHFKE